MTPDYLLTQLVLQVRKTRKAQRDYYAYRGDPKTDKIKQDLLKESKRHEQDLDGMLITIGKTFPIVEK